jgi:serine/threonine protein kinase
MALLTAPTCAAAASAAASTAASTAASAAASTSAPCTQPENLLLDAQGYLKVVDFGFAIQIPFRKGGDIVDRTFTLCGTPEYLAPELVSCKGHNKAVDYWALGVLLFELLCGATPFEDEQQTLIFDKIVNSKNHLHFPK